LIGNSFIVCLQHIFEPLRFDDVLLIKETNK